MEENAHRMSSRNWMLVATLVGIAGESLLTSPILFNFPRFLAFGLSAFDPNTWYALSFLLIVFPLFYPPIIAYFIRPKRIVSPLQITLGAWAVDTLAGLISSVGIASTIGSPSVPQLFSNAGTVYGDFGVYTSLFFPVAFIIGIYEILGTKWFIGVDIEGMRRETFSITVPAEEIAEVLQSKLFFPKQHKTIAKFEPDRLVMKWYDRDDDTVVLGLCKDPNVPHRRSILATIAYREGSFYISEDENATIIRDDMKTVLEAKLKEDFPSAQFVLEPKTSDLASLAAYEVAKSPSRSKIALGAILFSELSTYLKVAIGLTFLALFLTPIGYFFKFGNFDYGSIFVVLFVALVAELGLAVKDEITLRRRVRRRESWPPKEA